MKKNFIIMTALFLAVAIQAKDYKIVLRPTKPLTPGRTEVTVTPGTESDTITVIPGKGVTEIALEALTEEGDLVRAEVVTTGAGGSYSFSTQTGEAFLVVRDSKNEASYIEIDD